MKTTVESSREPGQRWWVRRIEVGRVFAWLHVNESKGFVTFAVGVSSKTGATSIGVDQ